MVSHRLFVRFGANGEGGCEDENGEQKASHGIGVFDRNVGWKIHTGSDAGAKMLGEGNGNTGKPRRLGDTELPIKPIPDAQEISQFSNRMEFRRKRRRDAPRGQAHTWLASVGFREAGRVAAGGGSPADSDGLRGSSRDWI